MSSLRDRRRGKRASLDEQIAQLAGVRPILTVSLARNQAWLRGRAMPADAVPGRSHTRASSANGQSLDGVWSVFGSGVARDVPGRGQLDEPSRANKCQNYNAAPNGSLTNVTKFGDAAATLTEVDDSAALLAAGLQNLCPSGKVFKLDNTAGVAAAVAWCAGTTANTNAHTASAYVRGGTGSFAQYSAGGTPFGAWGASSSYVRRVGTFTPVDASRVCAIVADAGQIVYFILNQLEEGSFATSPIVVAGASATRAADVATIDLLNPGLYDVSGQPELASNGSFASDTGWTKGTGWTISGGVANASAVPAGASGYLLANGATAAAGKVYLVTYTLTLSGGGVGFRAGDTSGVSRNTSGTYTEVLHCAAASVSTGLGFERRLADFTGTIDNVSIKEIPAAQVINYPCTIVVGFEIPILGGATSQAVISLNGPTTSNRALIYNNSTIPRLYVDSGAVNQANINAGAMAAGAFTQIAARVSANDTQMAKTGTLGTRDTSCLVPSELTQIILGAESAGLGSQLCGYLSYFSIVRGGAIDGNLQRLAP